MNRVLALSLAVVGFLGLAAAVLWIAGGAFAKAQQRTQEYRYISDALSPVKEPEQTVVWSPAARALVRDVTPEDEAMVGRALTQAWRAFVVASETGKTGLLADHFVGIALARAELAAAQSSVDATRMVVLEQAARPAFVHLDGSIFQLEALAITVRFALRDGELAQYQMTRDEVLTTLSNESTGWRIFSHERRGAETLDTTGRPTLALPRLQGVNYYPAETPWRRFWPEFDPSVVAADLDLLSELQGNAVRIFLPAAAFGPDAEGARNLLNLQSFLALAADRKIAVIPTLFDLKPGYRPARWAEDVAYLRRVLPVLAASSAVVLVDLKNEPDLDRDDQGHGLVEAWLTTMVLMASEIAPDVALTIGWSSAEAASGLADRLDAISYHDYADVEGTADRLAAVKAVAGQKPVLVTEIGASSYSLALGFPGSESAQAAGLRDRLRQLSAADGVLVWTLHDFAAPDPVAVGASPWVRRLQSRYGLYDLLGAPKPAAGVVAEAFAAPAADGD